MAKILIISEDLWYPPNYGDALRQYQLLKYLSRVHDYTWCCRFLRKRTTEEDMAANRLIRSESLYIPRPHLLLKFAKVIPCLLTARPLRQAAFNFRKLWQKIRQLTSTEHFDIIQIEHIKMAEYAQAIAPSCKARKILTIQNIDSIYYRRVAQFEPRLFWRLIYLNESIRYRRFEKKILSNFDAFITVSEENIDWLKEMGVTSPIHFSRNGMNVKSTPFLNQSSEPILIIPGSMDYEPNIDAVVYFTREILPLIWKKRSKVQLFVVGRNPGCKVKKLGADPRIIVTGTVPEMTSYYKKAAITVVPLRSGAGTRLKIVESMAFGRVVISTTIGAEGLEYKDGENIFIADTPEKMAETIIRLIEKPELREKVAIRARNFVKKRYDNIRIAEELNNFYLLLLNRKRLAA